MLPKDLHEPLLNNSLVDVHCHIDSDAFSEDERFTIIDRVIKDKIRLITSPLTWRERFRALKLREQFSKWIFITLGSHPLLNEPIEPVVDFIEMHRKDIVGIGEVGLDYTPPYNSEEARARQIKKFLVFINLAKEMNLPLVIHSRSAGKYAVELLIKENAEKVVLHSFSGKVKYALKAVEANYYFSIPPTILYSKQKQKLVKAIPIDNILLESDSPALSLSNRELNFPWSILHTAREIAKIKKIDVSIVLDATSKNARKIFRI